MPLLDLTVLQKGGNSLTQAEKHMKMNLDILKHKKHLEANQSLQFSKNALSREEGAPESISHFLQQAAVLSQGTPVTVDEPLSTTRNTNCKKREKLSVTNSAKDRKKKKPNQMKITSLRVHGKSVVWVRSELPWP